MTISYTKSYIVFPLLSLLAVGAAFAQDRFTAYWEPQLAINYSVIGTYSHNFSLGNRSYLLRDDDLQFSVRQLDLVHFSNLQIRDDQSVALGIQYRLRKNFGEGRGNEVRLTQQYNITHGTERLRYGHRIRSEQRMAQNLTIHRFRYRSTVDFPLEGLKLDVGEPYFAGSLESLLSVGKGIAAEYDQRFSANLGWLLHKTTKIQTGVEYRLENYTHNTQQIFFITSSLVLSL